MPPLPDYVGASSRSNFSIDELETAALELGHLPTSESEIGLAISSGVFRDGFLRTHSYAARFWAAIRRHQTDCSLPIDILAQVSDISFADLYHYLHTVRVCGRPLSSYFSFDALDKAAEHLNAKK